MTTKDSGAAVGPIGVGIAAVEPRGSYLNASSPGTDPTRGNPPKKQLINADEKQHEKHHESLDIPVEKTSPS